MRTGWLATRAWAWLAGVLISVGLSAGAGCGAGGGGSSGSGGAYGCGSYPCDPAILTIENATLKTITESGWRASGSESWNRHDWTDGGTSPGIRPGLSTFLMWAVLEAGVYDLYANGTSGLAVELHGVLLQHPKTHFYVAADGHGEIR